ncbi:TPA: hypothetical protein I9059_000011 [Clostridium perfringens]|nr:hypothetical protein [Clostridium perfringens]
MENFIVINQKNIILENDIEPSLKLLEDIRPAWKSKRLIERVEKILKVDPSSACQRILNAAIYDLRDKIVIAGLDIAKQVAQDNKLPTINCEEDILENYSTSKIIDLSYKMGLLTRPEWRKISRAYEIRRDLEHEDSEYEADIADCMCIFKPCIDSVLSKDPIRPLRVTEIKDIVEKPEITKLDVAVIKDYERAPENRQNEIYKFLVSNSLNIKNPEIVRNNCISALESLRDITSNKVLLDNANNIMKKLGRNTPSIEEFKVYYASGTLPYFEENIRIQFFINFSEKLKKIKYSWTNSKNHQDILCELSEVGGLKYCPKICLNDILEWLILCYIGEKGGYGLYGTSRNVFYSDIGAPMALDIIEKSKKYINIDIVNNLRNNNNNIELACRSSKYVERRYQNIIDLFN